jgi:MBOAT, membrane-bound O-acyltransferase family
MSAPRVLSFLVVLGVPSLLAPVLVRFGWSLPGPVRRSLASIVCLVPLSAPFLWGPTNHPWITMLIAILGGIVMLKAIDWLAYPRYEDQPLRVWLALTFWPALQIEDVGVRIDGHVRRSELVARRLASGVAGLAVGLMLTALGELLDLPDRGIWLDSSLKALEIYAMAGGANDLMIAAFALAGYRATNAFRYPILARSVLDFWSRYNVWIHRWLKRHVFEPIGRHRRRPAVGILAVFAVSGLLHEYLIVVSVPELIGRQFAFFGLHGLGAIGGAWLGRRYPIITGHRAPRVLAIAATLGFVLLTAPIFIRCMDRIVDLHRDVGRWAINACTKSAVWRSSGG